MGRVCPPPPPRKETSDPAPPCLRAQPSGCRAWEQRKRRPSGSVRCFCPAGWWAPPPCTCPWPSTVSRTSTAMCSFSAASTGRSECSGAQGRGTAGWHLWGVADGVPDLGPPRDRARAALGLEHQIQDADRVIRGFESSVAQEAPIPAGPGALQERVSELQVRGWSASWWEGASPSIN